MTTGKWAQPGVPHQGWTCTDVEDIGEQDHLCEMCEAMFVRYVHTMEHPAYETLRVGCVCAGDMEQDLAAARRRETDLKSKLSRRARWLLRDWHTSQAGNDYINSEGFNVVVYRRNGHWAAKVEHRSTGRHRVSSLPYASADAAKLAALAVLLNMKGSNP
jgi:hypothetical protein